MKDEVVKKWSNGENGNERKCIVCLREVLKIKRPQSVCSTLFMLFVLTILVGQGECERCDGGACFFRPGTWSISKRDVKIFHEVSRGLKKIL